MITIEQARALVPGDRVKSLHYFDGFALSVEWEVYEPGEWDRWDGDPTIVQYLKSPRSGMKTYLFSHLLERYSLI